MAVRIISATEVCVKSPAAWADASMFCNVLYSNVLHCICMDSSKVLVVSLTGFGVGDGSTCF